MHLALDARSMQHRPLGGVARAMAGVLPYLTDRVQIELVTQRELPPADLGLPEHPLPTPWPGVATAWLQWSVARWLRDFDGIFHCPWYSLPVLRSVPMVTTIHDLTFERFPEWFTPARRLSYRAQARWAARVADAVVTTSRFVADDVIATYGVPSQRVFVAPIAVDAAFAPGLDPTAVLERLGVKAPYVVALGGAPRRNLPIALEAWRAVRRTTPVDLVVVGTDDLPHEAGLAGGRLDDADWAAVLSGAAALVYPTSYEGFGVPALEAAASGTPVVCAPVGALPEVLGDAAAWCEAPTAPAIAQELQKVLTDRTYAGDLGAAGLQRMTKHPTWSDSADAYYAAYRLAESH